MYPGKWAATTPDKPALIMADSGDTLSFAELEDRSLRLANAIRDRGIIPGEHIAMIAENRFEIIEAFWAALRTGTIFTAVNSHLTPAESSYIIADCDAKMVLISGELGCGKELAEHAAAVPHRIAIGGPLPGCDDYEDVLAAASTIKPDYEPRGDDMLYSSGTTGKPKGILAPALDQPLECEDVAVVQLFTALYGFDDDTVYLSPAPLYHAAPLRFAMVANARGGTAVIMPKFEPEAALAALEKYQVTHSQWVPTMFIRMLKLPAEVRNSYDLSRLKVAVHAAAPCPVEVKQQMIQWWGPVIYEYYAATESVGLTAISSEESLQKPGSVGRDGFYGVAHICGPDGSELPPGEIGTIYFDKGTEPFSYYKDPVKTSTTRHPVHPTWATTGDLGYLDEDRYLYLAERSSFLIITGGVNIYPQEIEGELALHPDILDVAVVAEPHDELGQIAVAYIQPAAHARADEKLSAEILESLADRLAHFKLPRKIYYTDTLPRTPTGKLVKRKLQEHVAAPSTDR